MAFKLVGSLTPHGAPVLMTKVLGNSTVSTLLDSLNLDVTSATEALILGVATEDVFGHLMAHVRNEDVGVETSGASGAASGSYVGTFTAPSTNETVAKNKGKCDISKMSIYDAELDAAIGTDPQSDIAGTYIDLIDENTLDEDTAAVTQAQYFNWGPSPEDSTKARVSIFESQVFGPLGS